MSRSTLEVVALCAGLTLAAACGGPGEGEHTSTVEDERVGDGVVADDVDSIEGGLSSAVAVGSRLRTTAAIHFRAGPGRSYASQSILPYSAILEALRGAPQNGYYNVRYQGVTGWASGYYLRLVSTSPAPAPVPTEPTPTVPAPPAPSTGVLDVPYISQFRPSGADSNYINGSSNCGPTSMAMIGRYYGYGSGMTDAQLVTHLNLADGRATGATSAEGIKQMAAELGKPVVHRLGPDLAFVDRSLAEGKPLAARGIFTSVRHYIVVTGKDAQGNYTVNDPASSSRKTVTPSQLSTFIRNHPEGAFFSIG